MTAGTAALPRPLVTLRHPFRWSYNKVSLIIWGVVFAHVGMFIVTGLYYGLFETTTTMNDWWHHAVSNSDLRHSIRDVGEGVLGGLLAQAVVWNHYKKGALKAGKWLDKLEARFPHVPTHLLAVIIAAVCGAVAFYCGYEILHALHIHAGHQVRVGKRASLWARTEPIWTGSYDKKVLGYLAAFATHRPLRMVFDDAQAWFVQRRITAGRKLRFYHTPTYKARYNDMVVNPSRAVLSHGWQGALMGFACLAGVVFTGYGYYVLTYKATG